MPSMMQPAQDDDAGARAADSTTPSVEYTFLLDLIGQVNDAAGSETPIEAPTEAMQTALAALLVAHAKRCLQPYFTTHGRLPLNSPEQAAIE